MMGVDATDIARFSPEAQRQILQKLGKSVSAHKYRNEPDKRGNIRFDSKKEARRYDELMLMLKAGKIRNLRLQAQYTLQESFITPDGKRIRAIRYVADFAYETLAAGEWRCVVEDVKSKATKTAQYNIKKKMLCDKYQIEIQEI